MRIAHVLEHLRKQDRPEASLGQLSLLDRHGDHLEPIAARHRRGLRVRLEPGHVESTPPERDERLACVRADVEDGALPHQVRKWQASVDKVPQAGGDAGARHSALLAPVVPLVQGHEVVRRVEGHAEAADGAPADVNALWKTHAVVPKGPRVRNELAAAEGTDHGEKAN
jgi:hypothetical protein